MNRSLRCPLVRTRLTPSGSAVRVERDRLAALDFQMPVELANASAILGRGVSGFFSERAGVIIDASSATFLLCTCHENLLYSTF